MPFSFSKFVQETYPGLIRVKKVFPMGPAYESGELRPYDIILEANGVALSGLTNHVIAVSTC